MSSRLRDLGQHSGHELEGVDALGSYPSVVMARGFREVEDLVLIGLELQPGQAHRRPDHVAHQRLQRLGVASGQPYLVVDGEARVFPGQQKLQPLLTEQLLAAQQAQDLVSKQALGDLGIHIGDRNPLPRRRPTPSRGQRMQVRVRVDPLLADTYTL